MNPEHRSMPYRPKTTPIQSESSPKLKVLRAAPRGFCAGVDRAIKIVELALAKHGPPVYVRHEIVHNQYVVDQLRSKGAIFVEELDEIPETDQPIVFSAHGVAKSVPEAARRRNLHAIDATCPLVTKVHREAERQHAAGKHVILIGHKGHVEVIGTIGQLPEGAVTLVESVEDVARLVPRDGEALAYATQTTLSVDDTAEIIAALKARFPAIAGPNKEDICYATTNRQAAVKAIAARCEAMIVVGAPNSSNSKRLVEVAQRAGCARAFLVQRAADLDLDALVGLETLGITAGASAPEVLVDEILAAIASRFEVDVQDVVTAEESIAFNVPRELRAVIES
jgi:4-hydroxy-3-methylbut-2-enyl diphosphate reductase